MNRQKLSVDVGLKWVVVAQFREDRVWQSSVDNMFEEALKT